MAFRSMSLTQPEQALLAYLRNDRDNSAQEPGVGNVSWDQLCDAALCHGLGPLLYAQLVTTQAVIASRSPEQSEGEAKQSPGVPAPLLGLLEGQYFASLGRNVLIYHEVEAILDIFRREGFQAILLKGTALAGTVYPNIALRPMSDLDLLIRVHDLPAAQETLTARGYVFHPDRARGFERNFGGGKMFTRQTPYPLDIDLRWHLLEWPCGQQATLLAEWLWNSAPERRVADIPALVLSPEGQILHLMSHLAKHCWQRLLWFYDIAQVVRYYEDELDWDVVLAKAREFEILRALQVTLARTIELLAPPVPSGLLKRIESKRVGLRERAAFTLLTARDKHAAILLGVISKDSLLRKLRFLATVAFPSAEYMIERYQVSNRRKLPLYYAYRLSSWFYLLLRSLFSVLSQVLKRPRQ